MKKLLIGLLLPHALHTYADANIYGRFGGGVESLQIRQGGHKAGIRDFDSYVGMEGRHALGGRGNQAWRPQTDSRLYKGLQDNGNHTNKSAETGNARFFGHQIGTNDKP